MQYKEISRILGKYLLYFTLILCIPFCVALYYHYIDDSSHPHAALEFLETIFICFCLSLFFQFLGRNAKGNLYRRESILLVVIIWLLTAFISAMPFYFTKNLSPLDSYFEAMSGLTTTGASMMSPKAYNSEKKEQPIYLTNIHVPEKTYTYYGTIKPLKDPNTNRIVSTGVEAVSYSLMFWRSFIQWLGGMGIVVLFLAVLPSLAVGGKYLYQTEIPGPTKDSITPRIKDTASLLWKFYLLLTILQIFLLIWTNPEMQLLDAFCITFSTLSTGGFSLKNNSIGAYNNPYTEWIVIIFMILGSINFAFYFHIIRKKFNKIYEPDFLFFLIIIIIGSLLVAFNIYGHEYFLPNGTKSTYDLTTAIREGSFQSISAQTSTGFSTQNYDLWPFAAQTVMLVLMFIGGMAGSTCGGIKTSRFYILYKIVIHRIESIFRPDVVRRLVVGKNEIEEKTALTVLAFFCIVIFFTVIATIIFVFDGLDPTCSIGTVACMINNIGMAFNATGPDGTFNILSPLSKVISIILMLVGRLEFFAILILFVPGFWKSHK